MNPLLSRLILVAVILMSNSRLRATDGLEARQQAAAAKNAINSTIHEEPVSARIAIQVATNNLNTALLLGDPRTALGLLAADFELGQHQYPKQDAAWMGNFLPRLLQLAHFTGLSVSVSALEFDGRHAVAVGHIEASAALKAGGEGTSLRGGYGAV